VLILEGSCLVVIRSALVISSSWLTREEAVLGSYGRDRVRVVHGALSFEFERRARGVRRAGRL
jgi:hypothetical protein